MGRTGKSRLHRLFRIYHRRAGIISVLVVLVLTSTGIFLNHIDLLYRDSPYVKSGWLLNWYGIEAGQVQGFSFSAVNPDRPSDIIMADGTLIAAGQAVLFDQQNLLGVVIYDDLSHVFTQDQLHLLTRDGRLVESLNLAEDTQVVVNALRFTEQPEIVLLEHEAGNSIFNLVTLEVMDDGSSFDPAMADEAETLLLNDRPADARLARQFMLHKSRVLTDIHSGRILGPVGPWLVDLFALLFLFLAVSGVILWFRRKG